MRYIGLGIMAYVGYLALNTNHEIYCFLIVGFMVLCYLDESNE